MIGLTTGIFGTAIIKRGDHRRRIQRPSQTIATPRITALNNRTAQVETGSQIPVVTPQLSGGGGGGGTTGGLLLTTSFVSVPLRLSVTPQISNADTVILRVVAENNSINTTIASAGGTPGIDSQRMQTEVLVPDGGTTVVGGAIQDVESNRQDRTPGLSGIPVLGNLFKRRLVRRDTAELLFFITPRIYRPDFQGRPLPPGSANSRQRQTIEQPVPLGNPMSNTPVPGQMVPYSQTQQQQGVPYGQQQYIQQQPQAQPQNLGPQPSTNNAPTP
ncbi:MAG: type II and III secretion system protein [Pyrinomonadaceae bacterium]